jgi:type I restriction enzyme S subunit
MTDQRQTWTDCRVGVLGDTINGLTFRPQDVREHPSPDLIACFRTSNIQKKLTDTDTIFVPRTLLKSDLHLLREGDVLISTANSDDLVGKCVIVEGLSYEATLGGFISAFRVNQTLVVPRFFYYWLSSPISQARLRALSRKTTNIANLAMSDVTKISFRLPPLSEQQRIVEILQEADEVHYRQVEAESKTAELAPAVFTSIFGTPDNWEGGLRLGDLVRIVGGGTPSRRIEHYYSGNIPWATSKDIKTLYLRDTEEHVTEEAVESSATNVVPEGTVLVVVKSKILMHTLPVAITQVPMCFGQDIKGLIPIPGILPEFLVHALQAQLGRVLSRARGANTEGLTLEALRSLKMPAASKETLQRFQIACQEIRRVGEDLTDSGRTGSLAIGSISAHAFSGGLTAEWREANKDRLAIEVRERDQALKAAGVLLSRPRRTVADEIEELLEVQIYGIFAELNGEQRYLVQEIRRMVGGVRHIRYFSSEQLSDYVKESTLHRNPKAIEGHLVVLAARGIIIPVSREQQTEDTGEYVYGDAYRLPRQDYEPAPDEAGEPVFGDSYRLNELERLANKVEDVL